MKTEFDEQRVAEAFRSQADSIRTDWVPTEQVVRRGRFLKRRHTALLSAAAIVVVGGATFAGVRVLRAEPRQLSVSSPTDTTEGTGPATITSEPTAGSEDSGASVDLGAMVPDNAAGAVMPLPYRDGFLVMSAVPSDDSANPATSTVSFGFTTDGTNIAPIGVEVEVAGVPMMTVDGDTVLLVVPQSTPEVSLHLYWSDDLARWSNDVVDVSGIGRGGELTPAMAELVSVTPMPIGLTTNGSDWVANLAVTMLPTEDVLRKFADGVGYFTANGLVATNDAGEERLIPPDELGVTAADLAVFGESDRTDAGGLQTISGQRGSSTVYPTSAEPYLQTVVAFGDGFAGLDMKNQLSRSTDGKEWSPLALDLEPGEEINSVAVLGGDLLVVTTGEDGARAYRVTADGTATFLGGVPVPEGSFVTSMHGGQPIFSPAQIDENNADDFVVKTQKYEVTIGSPAESNPTENMSHYVIRDLATGEIVAENTRPGLRWIEGEIVEGERVVVFTDGQGRPDVVIPFAELEAAESAVLDSTVPPSLSDTNAADPEFVELATADGVHWYSTAAASDKYPLAVNGNSLLVVSGDDVAQYEVIDLSTAATAQAG